MEESEVWNSLILTAVPERKGRGYARERFRNQETWVQSWLCHEPAVQL